MISSKELARFTLVEMFITMALLGVLASMLFPSFKRFRSLAEQTQCQNNAKSFAAAMSIYIDDYDGFYPYGVGPDPFVGNGIPLTSQSPQELIYDYLTAHKEIYACPSDPTPQNYQWWRYRGHPNNLKSSSYMFCEYGLYGNMNTQKMPLKLINVLSPTTYVYMTDGNWCPNGWNWGTLNPITSPRIDWDHDEYVNILYGDLHVDKKWRLDDISNMRKRPDIK